MNYSTVLTENNNSNIRIIANNIVLQNWGRISAGGIGIDTNLSAASNFTVMTIRNSNVGIRSSIPSAALDVTGDINVSGNILRNGAMISGTQWQMNGTTTFLPGGSQVGIGTNNTQGFDIYTVGTISASNIVARNSFFIANDNQSIRNALQLSPLRSNVVVELSSQSDFVFTQEGIFNAHASNADVYINGLKLVYQTPTIKDYDLSREWVGTSNTRYTITLVYPATNGDVVDISVWPTFYNTATCNMPGYVYQQVGSFQWISHGTSNTYNLGNVGIGTVVPQAVLDVYSVNPALRLTDTRSSGTATVALRELNTSNGFDITYDGVTSTLGSAEWNDRLIIASYSNNSVATRYPLTITRNNGAVGFGTTTPSYSIDVASSNAMPVMSGLIGYYTGESWDGAAKQWNDLSGAGNHVPSSSITPQINVAYTSSTLRPVPYLFGNISAGITFPSVILPAVYTLFHVARYNGTTRGRIFSSGAAAGNWLSGFHENKAGVAYHGDVSGWITAQTDVHGTNWVISSDQRNMYRSQGINRTLTSTTGGSNISPLTINATGGSERSEWAVAEVIVYNRELSITEIVAMERYLINKYADITTGYQSTSLMNSLRVHSQMGSDLVVNPFGVGIGTASPRANFDVRGNMSLGTIFSNSNYRQVGSNLLVPISDGAINGINVNAINERTRPSYTTVNNCVGTWTSRSSANTAAQFISVCWSASLNMFLTVAFNGSGNRVMYSRDGMNWIAVTSGFDSTVWYTVCWSPELNMFVAGGDTNRILYSYNGVDWTQITVTGGNWYSICWAAEISTFVAVTQTGSDNRVAYSSNGISWQTTNAITYYSSWTSVCWSPELGIFVAVNSSSVRVMTSTNGINWTARPSVCDTFALFAVCWSPELSLFVIVVNDTNTSVVFTSPDGKNWTMRNAHSGAWTSICWAPELCVFVAVSNAGNNKIMTSVDGITWTLRTSPGNANGRGICWSPELGIFVAVSGDTNPGRMIMTSRPGNLTPINSVTSGIETQPPLNLANNATLPYVNGLVGYYTGDSWSSGTQLTDLSGANNHATITGTIAKTTIPNTNIPFLFGSCNASVLWSPGILPPTYTLFHVAKYNNVNQQRIFQGANANWLSGFWQGKSGVAFHGGMSGWLTQNTVSVHGANWVISTDRNSSYRSQGIDRTIDATANASVRLTINGGWAPAESSDWAVAEVAVYNRTLTATEIDLIEAYLINKYTATTTGFPSNYGNYTQLLSSSMYGNRLLTMTTTGVGIGTTIPTSSLEIFNNTNNNNNGHIKVAQLAGGGSAAGIYLRTDDDLSSPSTIPRYKTGIFATGNGSFGISDLNFVLNNDMNTSSLNINNDTRMIIKRDGNVGIGTVSPQSRLHVMLPSSNYMMITTNSNAPDLVTGIEFGLPTTTTPVRSRITSTIRANERINLAFTVQNGANNPITAMTLSETGNVGIGSLSPTNKLHIYDGNLLLNSPSSSNSQIILDANDIAGANFPLRINSDLRLIPTGSSTLGRMIRMNSVTSTGVTNFYDTGVNPQGDYFITRGANNTQFVLTTNDMIGIGTTNPRAKISIAGIVDLGDTINNCKLCLWHGGTPSSTDTVYYGFGVNDSMLRYHVDSSAARHQFFAGSSPLMTIKGDGNVGIGSTNPQFKLDVNGNIRTTGSIYVGNSANSQSGALHFAGTPDDVGVPYSSIINRNFDRDGGTNVRNDNSEMLIMQMNDGSVSDPPTILDRIRYLSPVHMFQVFDTNLNPSDTNTFYADNNYTTAMYIKQDGNVGIGTRNPQFKLDVNGDTRLAGKVFTNYISLYGATNDTGEASSATNTYLKFDAAGSGNDWCYFRQIGTDNQYNLALDFHDDGNDAGFVIRDVKSTDNPDTITERFKVKRGGGVDIYGDLSVTGKIASGNPVFSARISSTQSLSNVTATKVAFNNTDFDTASCFSTSTYRYTPNVAGYYQFNWSIILQVGVNTGSREYITWIQKNDAIWIWGTNFDTTPNHYVCSTGTALIYMNGSTDYVEVFASQSSGGLATINPSTSYNSRFSGVMVRGT
jgi:hypothetical protein